MAPPSAMKRKIEESIRTRTPRPKKRIRKQKSYHSSSEESNDENDDAFTPMNLAASDGEQNAQTSLVNSESDQEEVSASTSGPGSGSDSDGDSFGEDQNDEGDNTVDAGQRKSRVSKSNNPEAFATSISKILSTKLSRGARQDPVLSRSRDAVKVSTDNANAKLELRAKAKIRADAKQDLERGRVQDVLGLETGTTGEVAEEEKRLRKIAQRGVVKLFNAVRAAQVRGEEAAREARKQGAVGHANREEKVTEMSKQGFLDLINGKGSRKPIEEAR